jgi:hypothetical protein
LFVLCPVPSPSLRAWVATAYPRGSCATRMGDGGDAPT